MDFAEVTHSHFVRLAASYDATRAYEKVEFWVSEILRLCPPQPGRLYVDLGCGTGMYALALAARLEEVAGGRCRVAGVDPEGAMLAQAVRKDVSSRVTWLRGTAEDLPFADETVDMFFLSQVWHHVSDRERAAREILRCLKAGGVVAIKTFSHAHLRAKPAFTLFPEMLDSQLARYQDIEPLKALLRETGFVGCYSCEHNWEAYETLEDYLKAAEGRLYSMYSHLTEEQRAAGISRIRARIRAEGNLALRNDDLNALVVATKPG